MSFTRIIGTSFVSSVLVACADVPAKSPFCDQKSKRQLHFDTPWRRGLDVDSHILFSADHHHLSSSSRCVLDDGIILVEMALVEVYTSRSARLVDFKSQAFDVGAELLWLTGP